MSPGNSTQRTRKHSRCNMTPQKPSIFHLLASTVKLGQHHTAQSSSKPVPETSPLSKAGALHLRAAGKETSCFEKSQPGEQEITSSVGSKGELWDTKGQGHQGTPPSKHLPARDQLRCCLLQPLPLLSDHTAPKQALSNAGGQDNATVFLHSSCTFLTKTLKSRTESSAVSALSHPSALTDLHATT